MLFDLEPLRLGIEPLLKFSYQEYDKRPAYSIHNTNERIAHMQLQDVVLIELDATLDGISNLIHQLTLVHTAVKLRSDAIRNSMAPVYAIPTEVLHEISRIVVHDARFPQSGGSPIKTPQQTGSSGAVSSLSRVCKRWRAATLDLPELWTAVCMPWSSAVRAREMLLEYAKRARNLPLELSSWTPGNFLTKLPLDSSLAPRVISATMLMTPEPCHWQDPDWSSPDWEESLSALEHATIIGHMQYPEQRVQFQDWVSKCRSMCLIDVRPNSRCWRKFQNLETLTLSQVDQYVLVDLSRKVECPNLRNLILLDITVRDEKQLRPGYPQPKKDKGAKIASGGHLDEGLVSLRIIGCDDEIMLLICDGWKLENLISFELRVRNYYSECVSEAKDCIRAFLTFRPTIQEIIITPQSVGYYDEWLWFMPAIYDRGNLIAPNARYMHLGLTQWCRGPWYSHPDLPPWIGNRISAPKRNWDNACQQVRGWIDERFLRLSGIKLYRMVIPESFVLLDDMQWYHDRVEVVEIIPTLETIPAGPHPVLSGDCPLELNYGITMEVYREE